MHNSTLENCFVPNVMLFESLITQFLCFLDFKERWSLRRVCKTWRMAASSPICWENVDLRSSLISFKSFFLEGGELYQKALWVSRLQAVTSEDFGHIFKFLIEGTLINLKSLEVYWRFENGCTSLGVADEVDRNLNKYPVESNCDKSNDAYSQMENNKTKHKEGNGQGICPMLSPNASFTLLKRIVVDCPIAPCCILMLTGQTPNLQDLILPRIITCHDCIPCCLSAVIILVSSLPNNRIRILQLGFTLEMKYASISNVGVQIPLIACAAKKSRMLLEEDGDKLAQLLINKHSESLICFWGPDVCVSLELYLGLNKCKNLKILRLPGWQALDNFLLDRC